MILKEDKILVLAAITSTIIELCCVRFVLFTGMGLVHRYMMS